MRRLDIISCNYVQIDEAESRHEVLSLEDSTDLFEFGAGMLFRTEAVKDAGGYNSKLRTREDLDLHLRLERLGATRFHVPIPLYRRYIGSDNLSSTLEHRETRLRMIRDAKKL
jgi:GT2 family glycosyltransferase